MFCFNFAFMQGAAFSQEQNIYFVAYINRLENNIRSNWLQPEGQSDKKAVILLTLDKDGNLLGSRVSTSSGNAEFDKSALRAVSQTAPFEHFPKCNNSERTTIRLAFNKYNFESSEVFDDLNLNQDAQKTGENDRLPISQKNGSMSQDDSAELSDTNKLIENVNFNQYLQNLQKEIKANWNPPKGSESKRVVTLFKIHKDGTLAESKIFKSSGNGNCDQRALAAIYQTAPFAPLPKEFKGDSIDVQFTFDYNVFGFSRKDSQANGSSSYPDFYKKQVETILSYNLPKKVYLREKYIMMKVTISQNGQLKDIQKTASSGDINFDNKVLAALKKASFPPIPKSLNLYEYTLDYTVNYKRNSPQYAQMQPETPFVSSLHLITSMLNLSSAIMLLHCIH